MTPQLPPDHEVDPRAVSEGDAKVRLYGASDFAQGYFRRTALSATGRMILDEEHAILRRLIPPGNGAYVVDVGTGNGRLLPLLRQLGYEPLGVDLSLSMMVADTALSEQRLRGDARRLPFADGSVVGVLGHRLLYHYQEYQRLLAEFARVLQPGGWICADILRWTPSVLARRIGLRSGRLVRPIDWQGVQVAAAQLGLDVRGRQGAFALNPASATGAWLVPTHYRGFHVSKSTFCFRSRMLTAPPR
jgi:SAM-dependent methyltransferase